jgi:hypothetical protein
LTVITKRFKGFDSDVMSMMDYLVDNWFECSDYMDSKFAKLRDIKREGKMSSTLTQTKLTTGKKKAHSDQVNSSPKSMNSSMTMIMGDL